MDREHGLIAVAFTCVTAAAPIAPPSAPAETPAFCITDLGTLGGTKIEVQDVNNRGEVVGGCETGDGGYLGFVWLPRPAYGLTAGVHELRPLPGRPRSRAVAINDRGQIVGYDYSGPGATDARPLLWLLEPGLGLPAGTHDLGFLSSGSPRGLAFDINNCGRVVGASRNAFIWDAAEGMRDLGVPPGGNFATALGINDCGQIVGVSGRSGGPYHAFLYDDGTWRNLGILPGFSDSSAETINDCGQVVGLSTQPERGWIWRNGILTDLGTLPGDRESHPKDINARGQVVGWSTTDATVSPGGRAFLWEDGVMRDLNRLIPRDSGWFLYFAVAINDRGQIAGLGEFNGRRSGFLLTPRHCPVPGDTNGDGTSNIADAVYLLNHLFADGPAPVSCP